MIGRRLVIVCASLLLGSCSNGTPALIDIAQVPIPTKGEIASVQGRAGGPPSDLGATACSVTLKVFAVERVEPRN
jgi:hypothetical protein